MPIIVPPTSPVYKVVLTGSTFSHIFDTDNNKLISIRVKPGITSAIGSFEVVVPDSDQVNDSPTNFGKYKDVTLFSDAHIYLGYDSVPADAMFKGRIETIRSKFSSSEGFTRTFIGRDYGECAFRILKRRSWTGSDHSDVIIQDLRDNLTATNNGGLSGSNTYIASDTTHYQMVMENTNVFEGIKEVSDFNGKDWYVDINKVLHWFARQGTTGTETFTTGSNILEYQIDKDVTSVYNRIYVFGLRDSDPIVGSDLPTSHDSWTESGSTGWTATVDSGSEESIPITADGVNYTTGSSSIKASTTFGDNGSGIVKMTFGIPASPVMLNSDDLVHFYTNGYITSGPGYHNILDVRVKLKTDADNYYETQLEDITANVVNGVWTERSINCGVRYEGNAATGSIDQNTGSYRWYTVGAPDWYNINTFEIQVSGSIEFLNVFRLNIDGLYFGTRFQALGQNTASQDSYGLRPHIEISNKYNSTEYCDDIGNNLLTRLKDPPTQVSLTVTGSPGLQLGNKYAITLSTEGISSSNAYGLVDLEHIYNAQEGFISKCIFSDKIQIASPPIPIINYPILAAMKEKNIWEIIKDFFDSFADFFFPR